MDRSDCMSGGIQQVHDIVTGLLLNDNQNVVEWGIQIRKAGRPHAGNEIIMKILD